MTATRKTLPPPKGLGGLQNALSNRFNHDEDEAPPQQEQVSEPPSAAAPAPEPTGTSEPAPVEAKAAVPDRIPDGMKRRTIYMSAETSDLLDTTIALVKKHMGKLGDRVHDHEVFGAIVAAGAANPAGVAAEWRKKLIEE